MHPAWLISFLGILLQTTFWEKTIFNRSRVVVQYKKEAALAYWKQDYGFAALRYKSLVEELGVKEDEVRLNLGHCYFESHDTLNARLQYETLLTSLDNRLRSVALQQLGVLAFEQQSFDEALHLSQQALLANAGNEKARYNYELLLALNAQKPQDKNPPPQKEKRPDSTQKNQQEGLRRPKTIDLSSEKAELLLDAMQNEEAQYIQQRRRTATKKTDRNQPDW
jgi:Ca-activated chloride channel homolog